MNRRPWGHVELAFRQDHTTTAGRIAEHPLVRLLAFFCVSGVFAYTLFVVRVLRLFHRTQVVPDRVRQALDTLAEGIGEHPASRWRDARSIWASAME